MNSDDYKKFIESVCAVYGFQQNDKWKRVSKYKDSHMTFRDFQNSNGDILVISEAKNGMLNIHDIKRKY